MQGTQLLGRTALVTGASSGIGAAIVHEFAAQGANVVIAYGRNRDGAETTARDARALSTRQITVRACDVTRETEVDELIRFTHDAYEGIHILINNAGHMNPHPILPFDRTELDRALSVNLIAPLYLTSLVLPGMMRQRYGRIINISSTTGLIGSHSSPFYGVAKAALNCYTVAVAKAFGSFGITSNAIAASTISTRMFRNLSRERQEEVEKATPVQRAGHPCEIAACAAFLASSSAAYITGQILVVDGGRVMWVKAA